jgi:glycyl-tRNA synthetase beta chain
MDNIVSFFSLGLIPTGSEDPFALRRQALGIIAIMLEKGYPLPLKNLISNALKNLKSLFSLPEKTEEKIFQFFEQRFEPVFSERGYSPGILHSVLFMSLDFPVKEIEGRIDALRRFKNEKIYDDFLLAIKRVHNILPKATTFRLKIKLLIEEPEKMLKDRIDALKSQIKSLLEEKGYFDAILLLADITGPINNFFEHVLVMDKNEEIKLNRLALLKEVWETAITIADFSKLQPSR